MRHQRRAGDGGSLPNRPAGCDSYYVGRGRPFVTGLRCGRCLISSPPGGGESPRQTAAAANSVFTVAEIAAADVDAARRDIDRHEAEAHVAEVLLVERVIDPRHA